MTALCPFCRDLYGSAFLTSIEFPEEGTVQWSERLVNVDPAELEKHLLSRTPLVTPFVLFCKQPDRCLAQIGFSALPKLSAFDVHNRHYSKLRAWGSRPQGNITNSHFQRELRV